MMNDYEDDKRLLLGFIYLLLLYKYNVLRTNGKPAVCFMFLKEII